MSEQFNGRNKVDIEVSGVPLIKNLLHYVFKMNHEYLNKIK